eukprot:TRINITY_DN13026_c0_g1_i7.p1 TRINITY_DN13026_c0_g1~~TRINITY_DN13026_c0_g1_i7.p1  ORF type:complete len:672 (+),score=126.31 TRINITY_DN13026_c0_g1_i7:248-2017(+)
MVGYDGPVYMTHPTKAICPILLEDFRKIAVERKGESNFFTSQMIKACMKKVRPMNLHETLHVTDEIEIKAYYAGHVLGAAMFYVKVGSESVVYTGDYNMTPDRHLGSAWIDKVRPDLLITESTYATTIRDSKRCRERDFLKRVHDCVEKGGKVLIPVFALGRAQELCILIESYWEQMNLGHIPVYFSAGLVEKANLYYKLFINWTNQKIKRTFVKRNMFDFKHIKPFERSMMDLPGGMVLFATPGMLHAGMSLDVFKRWAPDENNMVIIPGYCVVGTVGNKLLTGRQQTVEIDKRTTLEVRCQVKNLSFSAHADAKGIMQLIKMCEPRNVLLVHGEKGKMAFLKQRIIREIGIPCYDPPNGATVCIPTPMQVPVDLSVKLVKRQLAAYCAQEEAILGDSSQMVKRIRFPVEHAPVRGVLVFQENSHIKLLDPSEAAAELGKTSHKLKFVSRKRIAPGVDINIRKIFEELHLLLSPLEEVRLRDEDDHVTVRSVDISLDVSSSSSSSSSSPPARVVVVRWNYEDEETSARVLSILAHLITAAGHQERSSISSSTRTKLLLPPSSSSSSSSSSSTGKKEDDEPFIPMEDCE